MPCSSGVAASVDLCWREAQEAPRLERSSCGVRQIAPGKTGRPEVRAGSVASSRTVVRRSGRAHPHHAGSVIVRSSTGRPSRTSTLQSSELVDESDNVTGPIAV